MCAGIHSSLGSSRFDITRHKSCGWPTSSVTVENPRCSWPQYLKPLKTTRATSLGAFTPGEITNILWSSYEWTPWVPVSQPGSPTPQTEYSSAIRNFINEAGEGRQTNKYFSSGCSGRACPEIRVHTRLASRRHWSGGRTYLMGGGGEGNSWSQQSPCETSGPEPLPGLGGGGGTYQGTKFWFHTVRTRTAAKYFLSE